jgi:hypothetical protein
MRLQNQHTKTYQILPHCVHLFSQNRQHNNESIFFLIIFFKKIGVEKIIINLSDIDDYYITVSEAIGTSSLEVIRPNSYH